MDTDALHIWAIDHVEGMSVELLSEDERNRALQFRMARDRDAFVSTRTALRCFLAAYLDAAPEAVQIVLGPRLKPKVARDEIFFNVSHSGSMSVLAFAHADVGVDVELMRVVPEMDAIVERNFSSTERRLWHELPSEDRERAFFLAWTRKEAYIKARGEGMYLPLDSFDVTLDPHQEAGFLNMSGWSLFDLSLSEYVVAAAISGTVRSLETWKLQPFLPEPQDSQNGGG